MRAVTGFHTTLRFFEGGEFYEHVKPYGFKVPPEDFPHTNIKINKVDGICVQNMRGLEHSFNVEQNGFSVRKVNCKLSYEDFHEVENVQPYFRELEELLKNMLGASRVLQFRHAIRKRHPAWPKATEPVYAFDQPTTTVHVDATTSGLRQEVEMKHGLETAGELFQGRVPWFK